jgi:hypothetical protein
MGRGPSGIAIPPGTPTATWDPKLSGTEAINNLVLAASPIALPEGYTVKMTSGERPGATVAGTGGPSQHAIANAADFQIFGPDGKPIENKGPDSSGLYGRLALTMRMIANPALKPWLAWGGNFTADGTPTGQQDLMHFDLGGDRGHLGTLAAMEQNFAVQGPPSPDLGGKGSVFGNAANYRDQDRPTASGLPSSAPGIALRIPTSSPDFGRTYNVTTPDGRTFTAPQTDFGPAQSTGRNVDISAGLANQMYPGGTAGSFPTDKNFRVTPAGLLTTPGGATAPAPGGGAAVQVASTGPLAGLLAPSGAPGPSPGAPAAAADLAVAQRVTPPGQPVSTAALNQAELARQAAPPPGPPGPPPGPPQSLVTPPPPAAPVPPVAMPQVAQAVPPGAIPGAPSPQRIRQAQQIALALTMAGRPVPPDIEAVAKFGLVGPTTAATEAAKQPYTAVRPGSAFPIVGPNGQITGWTQAPSAPMQVPGPPDAQGRPTTRIVYPSTTPGALPAQVSLGATGPSPEEAEAGKTRGQYPQGFGIPGEPQGPLGAVPQGIDPTKPIPSPSNQGRSYATTIPAIAQQARTPDLHTYGQAQPDWQKESGELADAGVAAQRAETNLMAIAGAYKMVQSGTWATEKNEFAGYLRAVGLAPPESTAGLAALQTALHDNYKNTLSQLKAVNSRFTGNEFRVNAEAGEAAGNQPEANLNLLSQDIAQVRQLQGLAFDWNSAQTMVGSDGSRWVNPDSFKTAWIRQNPLQPMIDQARAQIGPLKGMPGWTPPGSKSLPAGIPAGSTLVPGARQKGTGLPIYQAPDGSYHAAP